jgi:hypothetical protein
MATLSIGIGIATALSKNLRRLGDIVLAMPYYCGSHVPASTRPVQQGQVCAFDGVDDYIAAAHLVGTETIVSSWGVTPTVSAGRIDFPVGNAANVLLSDGTLYNLNHASGTTAYDSSGNGNDGTLTNGAAFAVDNTLPPAQDKLNLEGFTDDGGVLKPRDESDPTKDIDGGALQYSGSVYPRRPEFRESYAGVFDGADDRVLIDGTPYNAKTKGKVTGAFKTASAANQTIFAFTDESDTASDVRLAIVAGKIEFAVRESSAHSLLVYSDATFNDGVWHTFEAEVTDSGNTIMVDGVLQAVTYTTGDATTKKWVSDVLNVDILAFGGRQESAPAHFFNGSISNITLYDEDSATILGHWPLAEGVGATVHDISGNDNHGTITNASTATQGAGFWAGRIDGETNALNNNNGFTLYENGGNALRVPYESGSPVGSPVIPGGYTLTSENPAVTNGYNDAETELDVLNIAVGDNPSPASGAGSRAAASSTIEFSDSNATLQALVPADSTFRRDKSATEKDRFLAFSDPQTGADKTRLDNYTA